MLTRRDRTGPSTPLSDQATGAWYQTPKGRLQRYDLAPSPDPDNPAHWYWSQDHGWQVYRDSEVRPV